MNELDEIFKRARHRETPLSLEEASRIIKSGKGAVKRPGRVRHSGLGLVLVLIATVGIFMLWPDQQSGERTQTILPVSPERQEEVSRTNKPAQEVPVQTDLSPSTVGLMDRSGVFHSPEIPAIPEDQIPDASEAPVPTVLLDESREWNDPEGTDPVLSGENIVQIESPVDPGLLMPGDTPKRMQEEPVACDTCQEKSGKTGAPRKNFFRLDVLGYAYNASWSPVFQTQFSNAAAVSGNRFTLAYERLVTSRISLGISFSNGFAPLSHDRQKEALYFDGMWKTAGKAECFDNFKGWTLGLEGRYYWGRKKNGTGPYAGAYLAYGSMEERVYVTTEYFIPNEELVLNTLKKSRGHSLGLGLSAGWKIPIYRFYLEPALGFVVAGLDKGYHNWSYHGQDKHHRYYTLNKYELSIGYSF